MDRLAAARAGILAAVDLSQHSSTWVLLVVGAATLAVAAVSYGLQRKKFANLPPGPRNRPVIGALLEMGPSFYKTLAKFSTNYGPILFFRLGVQNLLILSSAETAEELLRHKDAEFCNRQTAMFRSHAKYVGLEGTSFPFAQYNAEYKLQRKVFMTEVFTTASVKAYENLRTQEVSVMVETVFNLIQNSKDNEDHRNFHRLITPVDVELIAVAVVRNILFSQCIGKRFDSLPATDELREFPELLDTVIELALSFNLVDYFPWLKWLDPQGMLKKFKGFDKRQRRFYKTILEKHRRELRSKRDSALSNDTDEGIPTNFVDALLRAQEKGTQISDNGIMVLVREMLMAGIDTTGFEIAWALVELVRHPKVLQRLHHELDAVVGKERPLQEADLPSLPVLNAVLLETLRLHGVVPFTFPHVNTEPSSLCGYDIPANTAVILNIWSMARDPKRWKEPLEFNPDRFMPGGSSTDPAQSETIKANGNCYYLLPFSSGRRMCPGYNLAMMLLLRVVGSLVHAFDWSPPQGCSSEDFSIEEAGVFLLCPASSLIVPTPRLAGYVYKSKIT